jgi:hypothetical protein
MGQQEPNEEGAMQLTTELLDAYRNEAAYCGQAKIRYDEYHELLELAKRTKAFDTLGLSRLHEMRGQDAVILDGHELRLLVMLAGQAKR